ncbi:MAG: hypothetical protein PHE56_05485 [Bacteroidales bacterium]|nr:hypothetical protein [Bacteroidales bacterium]
MNIELEKIVNSILAKGEINERSRELLMKKAETMGLDLIDFELEIESKIAFRKAYPDSKPPTIISSSPIVVIPCANVPKNDKKPSIENNGSQHKVEKPKANTEKSIKSQKLILIILLIGFIGSLLIGLALWLAFTFLWQEEKVYSDSVLNSSDKFRKVEFKENYKAERDSQKQIDGFFAGQTVIANIKKVYFYSQPDNNSKTESYFVNGQEALITEDAQGDFVKVSFEYNNVITEGYILKSEVVLKNENGN